MDNSLHSNSNYKQDTYIPVNKHKFIGKHFPFYRSSWEYSFMRYLDLNEGVVKWASEAIVIPYYDPTMKKERKYYPDFYMETIKGERFIVEIKPKKQTKKPRQTKNKKQSTFLYESLMFVRNKAKFEAASIWAKNHGMTFKIITEKSLNL